MPAGRPPYEPTDKDRAIVKLMVAGGVEQERIGAVLGIAAPTLRRHFRHEIAVGAAEVELRVITSLVTMATTGKNFNAARFYAQARMGWSEKVTVSGELDVGLGALVDELERRRKKSA